MQDNPIPAVARKAFYAINEAKRELASQFAEGLTPNARDYDRLIDWACAGRSAIGNDPEGGGNESGPGAGLALSESGVLSMAKGKGVSDGGTGLSLQAEAPLKATESGLTLSISQGSGLNRDDNGISLSAGTAMKLDANALHLVLGDGLTLRATKIEALLGAGSNLIFKDGAIAVDAGIRRLATGYGYEMLLKQIAESSVSQRKEIYILLKFTD